jgi:hypothetical protein
MFGQAVLMMMLAAELMFGYVVGVLTKKHTDEDYRAWKKLKMLNTRVIGLQQRISYLRSAIEIAKRHCMAGMLRAQNVMQTKRRTPYYRVLALLILSGLLLPRYADGQQIEHYEGILIDTSASISKDGQTNELFQEYLLATREVLLTEPANTRVWVSTIASDSFGGVREILKGWTPNAQGVFTDDLNRARRQLASAFQAKSSQLSPLASGTDIIGGLWHAKAVIESALDRDHGSKTIWLFSDMMNETEQFPMPLFVNMGPDQMLERAKASGLIVPLDGYKIYVYGASPSGLTPSAWTTIKRFWMLYFAAAGAELVSYSAECDIGR